MLSDENLSGGKNKNRWPRFWLKDVFCVEKSVKSYVERVLKECPCVGEEIEAFVIERNVHPDAWRRIGVLTFDRNRKVKEKVTYESIRKHLLDKYGRKSSYGTVHGATVYC